MREQAFETAAKSYIAKRALEEQPKTAEVDEHSLPQHDPLLPALPRAIGERTAATHAVLLQQTMAASPTRATRSVLQMQQIYGNHYIQRVLALRRNDGDQGAVDPAVEQTIHHERGGGQALDSGVRRQMEPAFGADFSGVRVHTGAKADTLNRALNARAFTTGRDLFFRQGTYDPGSSSGRELLAHELTHVVQQQGGSVQRKLTVGQPGDKYEQEADQVARAIIHREQQTVQPGASQGTSAIHCQAKEEEKEKDHAKMVKSPIRRAETDEKEKIQTKAETSHLQHKTEEEEKKPLQTKLTESRLQRADGDDEAQAKAESSMIQRQSQDEAESAQTKPAESPRKPKAEEEEKKPVQTKLAESTLQRADGDDEAQTKAESSMIQRRSQDEAESAQTKLAESAIQRQVEEEEKKPVQTKLAESRIQRTDGDEEAQTKAEPSVLQRQSQDEEESAQTKSVENPLQRKSEEEEKKPLQTKLAISTLQRSADGEEQAPIQTKVELSWPQPRGVLGGQAGSLAAMVPPRAPAGLQPGALTKPSLPPLASLGVRAPIGQMPVAFVAPPKAVDRPKAPPSSAVKGIAHMTAPTQAEPAPAPSAPMLGVAGPSATAVAPSEKEAPSSKATVTTSETSVGAAPVASPAAVSVEAELTGAPTSETDPKAQAVMQRLEQVASQEKRHELAATKVAQAKAAVKAPDQDRSSRAQAQQVEVMDQQEASAPDEEDFVTLLLKQLDAIAPENMEKMEKFKEEGKAGQIKSAMTQEVNKQKETSAGAIKVATTAQADPESVEAPPDETPLPEATAERPPAGIDAQEVAPPPKPEAEISLQANKQRAEEMMAKNDIDEKQLEEANELQFSAALTAKKELAKHADQAPATYRTSETALLAKIQKEIAGEERAAMQGMHGGRAKAQSAVQQRQQTAKQHEEEERQKVTTHIQNIYQRTKQKVEAKLNGLDGEVNSLFDAEEKQCSDQFESYVARTMRAYKAERYSGAGGAVLWGYDKLTGLPDEVNKFYEAGKKQYIAQMRLALIKIGKTVTTRLQEAKAEIKQGKAEIQTFVGGLQKSLVQAGRDELGKFAAQFEALEQGVDAKKQDLVQKVVQRAKDARSKMDERIQQLQAENNGLLGGFIAKIKQIIQVIRDFKERVGALLKKSGDVVSRIAKAPIQFLKNLIGAVKLGFNQFADNIGAHLKRGLLGWLFGSMSEAGIELPSKFSPGAFFGLILQVIGLTPDSIRAKLVKLIGAKNRQRIELAWSIISKLIQAGPGGLWEMTKQYLGDLKERLLGEIKDWLITEIVKQAVLWVVSLFNPVSALLKAVQMIYNVVMFFVENIERILQLVESVIASIVKIVAGDMAGAATWIENAMARTVPIIIAFLARLLNLGGIGDKVKAIIKKIQKPVGQVINKLILKARRFAKKLIRKGKVGARKVKEKVLALIRWWSKRKSFKDKAGHLHELTYKGKSKNANLHVASYDPTMLDKFFEDKTKEAASGGDSKFTKSDVEAASKYHTSEVKPLEEKLREVDKVYAGGTGAQKLSAQKKTKAVNENKKLVQQLETALSRLSALLKKLFSSASGDYPPPRLPVMADNAKASSFTADYIITSGEYAIKLGTESGKHVGNLEGWAPLQVAKLTNQSRWVRMHLLPHKLGGNAVDSNLTPALGTMNLDFSRSVEQPAIGKAAKQPIWYSFRIGYYSGKASAFPRSLQAEWGFYEHHGGAPKRGIAQKSFAQEPAKPQFVPVPPNLNNANVTEGQIAVACGVDRGFVKLMLDVRKKNNGSLGKSALEVQQLMEKKYLRPDELDENGKPKSRFGVKDFGDRMKVVTVAIADKKIVLE